MNIPHSPLTHVTYTKYLRPAHHIDIIHKRSGHGLLKNKTYPAHMPCAPVQQARTTNTYYISSPYYIHKIHKLYKDTTDSRYTQQKYNTLTRDTCTLQTSNMHNIYTRLTQHKQRHKTRVHLTQNTYIIQIHISQK